MTSKTTNKFLPEACEHGTDGIRSRAGALVTVGSGGVDRGEVGCVPQTLHEWVKEVEVNGGKPAGVPSEVADNLKAMERENRELRQAD